MAPWPARRSPSAAAQLKGGHRRRRRARTCGAHRRQRPADLRPGPPLPRTREPDPPRDRYLSGNLAGAGAQHRARVDFPRSARHRSRDPSRDRTGSQPRSRIEHLRGCRRVVPGKAHRFPAHCAQHRPAVRGKLISRWRDRPIDTIGKRDVIGMIEDVHAKSGAGMARQVLVYTRRLFGWAAARDLVPLNPCAAVAVADLLPPKVSRDRVLSDAELVLVLKAIAGVGYPTAPYTRLLLMTACRRSEAADAVWVEFNLAKGHGCCRLRGEECQRARAAAAAGGARSPGGPAPFRRLEPAKRGRAARRSSAARAARQRVLAGILHSRSRRHVPCAIEFGPSGISSAPTRRRVAR